MCLHLGLEPFYDSGPYIMKVPVNHVKLLALML